MTRKLVFAASLMIIVVGMLGVASDLHVGYASPYTDVDVDTAYNMITNGSYPDLVVLDVRTQSEYDGGHIYGAVWIPHTELKARISELAGHEDHEIIVYCRSGVRSVNASETLDSFNFTKVYNMLGGILAWESGGYPVWIATVHNLNTTFDYDTIQEAIDAPQTLDGHTIFVEEGIYYEHVIVNKSIFLIGKNETETIIDGNFTGPVISIEANNINITGFTIQKSGYENHGIYVATWRTGNNISYNIITNNTYGISLFASSNNTVSGNTVSSNNGYGIWLFASNNNTVSGNIASNNGVGIFLDRSANNTLFNNNMTGNAYNFNVRVESGYDLENSVDASNMVDCKPIYYLKGVTDTVYDAQTNVGTFYLINCDNITIRDLTLTKNGQGVFLGYTTNSKIEDVIASNNELGIYLYHSSNNTVSGNIASNNDVGIYLFSGSNNNTVSGNIASNNTYGIVLEVASDYNLVSGNTASNNTYGIYFWGSKGNMVFHNNFINNTNQYSVDMRINFWDEGYPSGGNYWSDYNGTDSDNDGIGDNPYEIDENNADHFPLMGEFHKYNIWYIESGFTLTLISNSTISNFDVWFGIEHPEYRTIFFDVAGETGHGFCRLCIPKSLMAPPYTVTIDNGRTPVTYYNETLFDNGTHRWIYFAYLHSEHQVEIIPEFPSFIILPLFMIITLLAVIVYRRKHVVWKECTLGR